MEFETLLTTEDNPFNPFEQFDEWNAWDQTIGGYKTNSLLAKVTKGAYATGAMDDGAVEEAMEEIVKENLSGMHMLVTAKQWYDLRAAGYFNGAM
jgi:hypothetical protein